MKIDIHLAGWRLYLDLSQPVAVSKENAEPPTQLATPMRIGAGFYTWQQIRAAAQTDARQIERGPR